MVPAVWRLATPLTFCGTGETEGAPPRRTDMRKLLIFVGAMVGSTIGWYLGAAIGTMTAFIVSTIASGAGMYAGAKVAQHYG